MSNPEEIRRDIEATRAELSDNINALGDRSNPGNIARSQVDKVKEGVSGVKERIFGSPYDPYDDGAVGEVGDRVSGVMHDARDAVADSPRQLKRHTRGNPLAAGLIAAGVGALIGGLIPSTRKEREVAEQIKDAAEPLVDEVKEMAQDAKDHLQPMAEGAVQSLKGTAQDATENVKQDAAVAKDSLTEQTKQSTDTVKGEAQSAAKDVKDEVQDTRHNL